MAELDYTDDRVSSRTRMGATVTAILNWAGAGLSLALVAGLGWWGYQLLVRDVTGVPVVRALEGPMRIAPEDPGGARAAYQGLAVNAIAAEGTAAAPPEAVVLAPVEVDLAEEDQSMAALLPDAPEAPIAEEAARPLSATDLAVAAALGEAPELLMARAELDDIPAPEAAALTGSVRDARGLAASPRPAPRPATRAGRAPAGTLVASLDPAAGLPLPAEALDIDPSSIEPGARLVQLGAFPTEALAREEWDRIAVRFADFMQDKGRVIQEAEAGGRIFYRLRVAGFDDLSDSRRFCAVLVAGEASCIPVAWR